MARSSIIALTTFGSILLATIISLVWFSVTTGESRFEPIVGILGLLGGLAGILAERRTAAQERRRLALATLTDELDRVGVVLGDDRFNPSDETGRRRVYPQLPTSAVDAALVSGALIEPSDAELLSKLHCWRDEANEFNRRLELTEMRIFSVAAAEEAVEEIAEFDRAVPEYVARLRRELADLQGRVAATAHAARAGARGRQWARLFRLRARRRVRAAGD